MPKREVLPDRRHKHGNAQWSALLDAENRFYYYNSVTGESTYENPFNYSDDEDEDNISQLEDEESQKRAQRRVRIQEAQTRQQRLKEAKDAARGTGTEVVTYGHGQTYNTLSSQASWSSGEGETAYGGSTGMPRTGASQGSTAGSTMMSSQWYQGKDGSMLFFDGTTGQSYSQAAVEQMQAQNTAGHDSIGTSMLTNGPSLMSTWKATDDGQGHLYYYNHKTGETTWEPPALLPTPPDSAGFLTGGTPPLTDWVACDDQQGNMFYYNERTGESTWEPPLLLLPSPESPALDVVDTSSLAIVPLPRSDTEELAREPSAEILNELRNWDEAFDQDGNRYFVNTVSGETAWYLPGTTPSHSSSSEEGQLVGWESVWTDSGEQYFYNRFTGESRWDPPALALEQDGGNTTALVPTDWVSSSSSGDSGPSAPLPALPYSTSASASFEERGPRRSSRASLLALPPPEDKEATKEEDLGFLAALMARQLVLTTTPGLVKRVATEIHIDRLRKAAEREQMLARTYVAAHNHNRTKTITTAALGTKERLQAEADKDQEDEDAEVALLTRIGLAKPSESGGDAEGAIWSPRKGVPKASSGLKSPRKDATDASGSSVAYRPPSQESELAKQRRVAISMPKAAASSRFVRAVNLLTSMGSGSTTLREIDLSSEKIGDAGASHLSTLLVHAPLVTLVLNDNDITCAGARALAGAFKTNRSIRMLHLAANLIHDEGVRALTLAMWDNPALRVLNLNANPIHAEGAKNVALMIIEPACKLSSLFMNGPPVSRKLLEDSIQHSHQSEAQRFSTTDNSKELKVKRLGDMGTYYLSAALLSSKTVALHTLWLTSCNIGPNGVRALATTLYYNPHITNINLSLNKIGERGAEYFSRALQVNTTLQVLILDRCGIQPATLKQIKHLLTHKPKLSWDQQKEHAAMLVEDVKWLRDMCDVGKFPFRKESSQPVTPVGLQLEAHGQQDEQDSDEGSTNTNDEQDKVPAWVTAKDRNVLRSLLSMPEAEMKGWSRMWLEHTAALVLLYEERLSFELWQLDEHGMVNEEEVQEVKAVLHAMLEDGKRELSALYKAHQRASDNHRELGGFLDAALKKQKGLNRRISVGKLGVEATRAVLATLSDGMDEKVAMSERLEMEEQLLLEAQAQQAEVDREVEEARGEEQRARGIKEVTAQALRESVADDGERHVELQDEVQGCLWARMRITARKQRMERLVKETAALAERMRAEVVLRVKADEFKALVPFTSGLSSLDDLVRHSIVEEHHRHASMLEAQEIKEHIAEAMRELDSEFDELMGCARKVHAIKMRYNAQQQEQASGPPMLLLPHETETLQRVLEILERYYTVSPFSPARQRGQTSGSKSIGRPDTSAEGDRVSTTSTVVSSDNGSRIGVDLGAGFQVGTAETANRSPTASSDQTARLVAHPPDRSATIATSLPSSMAGSVDPERSGAAPAHVSRGTPGVAESSRDESQGSANQVRRSLPAQSNEDEAVRETIPALRMLLSAPPFEVSTRGTQQDKLANDEYALPTPPSLPKVVTSSMRGLKALAFNMRGHMDTLVNTKGLATEDVHGREVDLQASRQRLAVVARDHFLLVQARSTKKDTVSRFLSRKSGIEVMLAQATPNEHIKAAEKVINVAAEAEQMLGDKRQSVGRAKKIQMRRGAELRLRTPLEHHWDALRAQGIFSISKSEFKQIKYKFEQNKNRQVITKTLRSPMYKATVRDIEKLGMRTLFAEAERAGVFADAEEAGEKVKTTRDVVHMLAKKQFSQKAFSGLSQSPKRVQNT